MSGLARGGALFAMLVQRPVFLLTLFTTCLVIGGIAWKRVPIQMMPDGLVNPGLEVYATNLGASAQENEQQVARVLEEELRTLPGIEDIETTSRQDNVQAFVSFKATTDMNFAKAEVRDRIERARPKLPKTVSEVGIWSWNESDLPVMFFALQHPGDSPRTDFLIEDVIKRRLQSVDGVGQVSFDGLLDDSLRILLEEDRVRAAKLDLGVLIKRLSSDNFALPLGEIEDGGRRILLRSDMRFKTKQEIENYPIGGGLTIRDVGHVESVKTVRENLFRIDGRASYFGVVRKDGQANVVETCMRLNRALKELEADPELAGEFKFLPLFDQGQFIRSSIKQLSDTAWEGGLLAVLILFFFLRRIRLTLLITASIPISVLLAIAWVYFTGGSFNVLTMTGITLAMGMLIDNAIVVIENITRRRDLGNGAREAVVEGTGEVALAVVSSTLVSVVVFLPLVFMTQNPMLRIMLGQLGIPMCVSLLVSLLAALVFLPVATERSLGRRPAWLQRIAERLAPIGALPARGIGGVFGLLVLLARWIVRVLAVAERRLVRVLAPLRWPLALSFLALGAWRLARALPALNATKSFGAPGSVDMRVVFGLVLLGLAMLVGALLCVFGLAVSRRRLDGELAPDAAPGARPGAIVDWMIEANAALVGWSLRHRIAASLIAGLCCVSILVPWFNMKFSAFGQDESKTRLYFQVELENNFTLAQASDEMERYERLLAPHKAEYGFDHLAARFSHTGGQIRMFFDSPQRREHLDQLLAELRSTLPRFPGHKLSFLDENASAQNRNKAEVVFRLQGPDSEELERLAPQAVALLETVPGLSSISSPLENAPRQVRIKFDADLAQKLGVNTGLALSNISWALRGFQLSRFQETGREIPLIIEYDGTELAGLNTLRELEVRTGASAVPLSSFAELGFASGSRSIQRHNGQATINLRARCDNPARAKELYDSGVRALGALDLPRGVVIAQDDSVSTRLARELIELLLALLLALILVFILMGILFESFLLPISVLLTVPFAVMGSLWTLYLTGTAMDSVGLIGVIILLGIVANHGIVLIDRIHGLRRLQQHEVGADRARSVLEGCRQRVRPVLMTSLTAVVGLLPMALTEPPGEGIDYRALATCVAGGLALSTIFTLWIVPLAYTLLDDLAAALGRQFGASLRRPARTLAPVVEQAPTT